MKIGVFGGTFNPVHNGHIRLLDQVIGFAGLDRAIVLPDRIPPHKSAEDLASGSDRLEMCRMAFSSIKKAEISDWELLGEGKSYSVITLRHFHRIFPDDRLYFIMGSDMLSSFEQWYRYEEILSLAGIICMSRSREDSAAMESYAERLRKIGGEVILVPVEPMEISSSQIRNMLKKNEDCTCYLDKNVVQYIVDNKLYCD